MNVKDYRRAYEAELARGERPAAGRRPRGSRAAASAEGADALAADSATSPDVGALLGVLLDRERTAEERDAALKALKAASFLGPQFDPFRAEFKLALRKLIDSGDGALSRKALELLATTKDNVAQSNLVQGLREPEKALVPPTVALELLRQDDHGPIVAVAKEVLGWATDPKVREQALLSLTSDPDAKALFSSLMKDKAELKELRRAGAIGLQRLDPGEFKRVARKIVADSTDFDEIRATSRRALELLDDGRTDSRPIFSLIGAGAVVAGTTLLIKRLFKRSSEAEPSG
jgi:hypothetical protein